MEDSSQGFRRTRRESSSSTNTRMTPTSTNSSLANLPRSNPSARIGTGTSLLQERLRERKVESARQNRRRSVDLGAGDRDVQSSPMKAKMEREERRPSSSGVTPGKGMGVKQIEEQVSTLHKQNFDLKLELYHRRQRQETLEARLDAMEKQIAEQKELQEINEQLLAELEKRDQAVEEAVGIIVNLEDKVERLMQDRDAVRTFDAKYESSYFQESHEISTSPPTSNEQPARPKLDMKSATKSIVRIPSFLSEQSEGAEALRSLYLPQNHSYSDTTLPKLLEEANGEVPDSPRLSVLSESSFLSVYGDNRLFMGAAESEDDNDLPQRRHRKSSSVEKWIDERPAPNATALKPARVDGIRKNGFLSINDVLESPLQRLEKLKHTLEKHNTSLVSTCLPDQTRAEERRKSRELLHRGFTDKASFEHQQALPPTPDTISTSTLRHYQKSNETLSHQADAKETKLLNSTSNFPVPIPSHNAHQSMLSMRPRSAGETITSRREGHGWDTETAEDLTETGSLSSTASVSASFHPQKPTRIVEPDLFSFNDLDDPRDWGRDMMFNNDSASHLPVHTARRYNELRRSSMVEHPRSDDIVVGTNRMIQYDGEQSSNQYGVSPIDTSPRPSLPDRRSSLSATMKLRKVAPINNTASSPATKDNPAGQKKSKLAMTRFFTRSEQATPTVNSLNQQRPNNNGGRSYSHVDGAYDQEMARATPPPIKRNRTTHNVPAYRPCSAGEEAPRRDSNFGSDGADGRDERGVTRVKRRSVDLGTGDEESTAGKSRKWLGFGRTGSLRRS